MADKSRERALLETARKLYPWFPPGEIVDHEAPDFLLLDGADRIGIEVTQLFQSPKHGSPYAPHQVAKFHRRVMDIADRRAKSMRPLDVLVYFDYRARMDNPQASSQELLEFVRAHGSGTYDQLDGIPHGFSVVRIAEPLANQVPRWYCLDSGETLGVDPKMLSKIICSKNRLVPTYRRSADRVWLLIASSFSEFASNFYVPKEVEDWRFDFDFDKVLLLSSESGVFNLQRADRAA